MNIDKACTLILNESTTMWQTDGAVMPTVFAIGRDTTVFAQPFDPKGYELPAPARVAFHSMTARAVDAQIVGQIAEVFAQTRGADEEAPCEGELADCADVDPSIKTAICVEAYDMKRDLSRLYIARLDLSEQGEPQWYVTIHHEPSDDVGMILRRVAGYKREMKDRPSMGTLVHEAFLMRWVCIEMRTKEELNL